MAFTYKRRRPSIVRNFWVYRRLVALAMVLGLMLWFIWANNAPATVAFPFGLGKFESTIGLVILLSSLVGSVATAPGADPDLRHPPPAAVGTSRRPRRAPGTPRGSPALRLCLEDDRRVPGFQLVLRSRDHAFPMSRRPARVPP